MINYRKTPKMSPSTHMVAQTRNAKKKASVKSLLRIKVRRSLYKTLNVPSVSLKYKIKLSKNGTVTHTFVFFLANSLIREVATMSSSV